MAIDFVGNAKKKKNLQTATAPTVAGSASGNIDYASIARERLRTGNRSHVDSLRSHAQTSSRQLNERLNTMPVQGADEETANYQQRFNQWYGQTSSANLSAGTFARGLANLTGEQVDYAAEGMRRANAIRYPKQQEQAQLSPEQQQRQARADERNARIEGYRQRFDGLTVDEAINMLPGAGPTGMGLNQNRPDKQAMPEREPVRQAAFALGDTFVQFASPETILEQARQQSIAADPIASRMQANNAALGNMYETLSPDAEAARQLPQIQLMTDAEYRRTAIDAAAQTARTAEESEMLAAQLESLAMQYYIGYPDAAEELYAAAERIRHERFYRERLSEYANTPTTQATVQGKRPGVNAGTVERLYWWLNDIDGYRSHPYAWSDAPADYDYSQDEVTVATTLDENDEYSTYALRRYGEYMTPEQIATFTSVYNERGAQAAEEYLADVVDYSVNEAEAQRMQETAAQEAESFGGGLVGSLAALPARMYGGVIGATDIAGQYLRNAFAGDEGYRPIDTNTAAQRLSQYAGATQGAVAQNLNDAASFRIGDTQIGLGTLYGAAMDAGNSLLTMAATGGFGGGSHIGTDVVFGAGAFRDTFTTAIENGADETSALLAGASAGLAESIFEHVSIDRFVELADAKTARQLLVNAAKQGGVEVSEELATNIANTITEEVILGENSQVNRDIQALVEQGYTYDEAQDRVWRSWLGEQINTALSAFVSGGGRTAVAGGAGLAADGVQQYREGQRAVRSAGEKVISNDNVAAIKRLAESVTKDGGEKAGKVTKALKAVNAKETNKTVGRLYAATYEALNGKGRTALEESLKRDLKSMSSMDEETVDAVAAAYAGKQLTPRQEALIRTNDDAKEMLTGLELEGYSGDEASQIAARDVDTAIDALEANVDIGNIVTQRSLEQAEEAAAALPTSGKRASTMTRDGRTVDVNIEGIESAKDGVATLRVNVDGETITVDDDKIKYGNDGSAQIIAAAAIYGDKADVVYKGLRAAVDPGTNAGPNAITAARYFAQAYNYGTIAMPMETALKRVDRLPENVAKLAYELGMDKRNERVKAEEKRREERKTKGGVTGFDNSRVKLMLRQGAELTGQQYRDTKMLEAFAKATGVRVVLYESRQSGNEFVLSDAVVARELGLKVGAYAPNGAYVGGSIYIDINAGRNTANQIKGSMLRTMGHELTHYIKDNAPAEVWQQLQDFVLGKIADGGIELKGERGSIDDLIESYQAEKNLSYEAAVEEIVADGCEMMLRDTQVITQLGEQNPSLLVRIRDWINKWLEHIRRAFEGVDADNAVSREMMQWADELQQVWDRAAYAALEHKIENAVAAAREEENRNRAEQERAQASERRRAEKEADMQSIVEIAEAAPQETRVDIDTLREDDNTPLQISNPDTAVYFQVCAGFMQEDLVYSMPAGRDYIKDEHGTLLGVTGHKRVTGSARIESLLDDYGLNWQQVEKALAAVVEQDEARMKRMHKAVIAIENVADQMLEKGFKTVDGEQYPPTEAWTEYKQSLLQGADGSMEQTEAAGTEEQAMFSKRRQGNESGRYDEEATSIKKQMAAHNDELNRMAPVFNGDVELPKNQTKKGIKDWAVKLLASTGYRVERQNFGRIIFEESELDNGIEYLDTKAEYAAIAAIPKVLKRGIIVGRHPDHKDRRISTITFGAPVVINGERGNMGVVVRQTGRNRYKTHRIVTPDGKVFNFNENKMEVEPTPPSGAADKTARFGSGISSTSDDRIAQNDGGVKRSTRNPDNLSDRELLANALESATRTKEERDMLAWYKRHIKDLNKYQQQMDAARAKLAAEYEKEGNTLAKTPAITTLREQINTLQKKINDKDRTLLRIGALKPLRAVRDRAREDAERAARKKYDERLKSYRERTKDTAERKVMRGTITRISDRLSDMLRNPTDQRHVPMDLQDAVANVCRIMDTDDVFPRDQLQAAVDAYRKLQESDASAASLYDPDAMEMLERLRDAMADKRFSELDAATLKELREVMRHMQHIVSEANRVFVNGRRERISDLAESANAEFVEKGTHREHAFNKNALYQLISTGQAMPPYFFKRIGGTMGVLGKQLLDGETTYGVMARGSKAFFEDTQKQFHYSEWANKKGDTITLSTESGHTLTLTREQALGIYATAKREAANKEQRASHLETGGVVMQDKEVKKGKILKYTEGQSEATPIVKEDVEKINAWLTAEQKAYADAVVRYMSNDMARLGNEVSMDLYGYEKFGEGYYYPYKTSSDFRQTKLGEAEAAMLKSMSFTKRLTRMAKNPIVITDFTVTCAGHVNQMLTYYSFARAQDSFMRVYDYHLADNRTVKSAFRASWGDAPTKYIQQFMTDLYGGVTRDVTDRFADKLVGRMKKTSVMLNASVAVQQPSALIRAMALVDPKYFVAGEKLDSRSTWDELSRYSGTAVIKDMGGFDTNVGRSATEWISAGYRDPNTSVVMDKIDTVGGFLPAKMDQLTWTYIWHAVKRETAAKTKLKGQRLLEAAGKRFDEVIRFTQVYDSVMAKSQNMRSKTAWSKMLTSFMSEPTVTYNLLLDAMNTKLNGKKYLGRAVGAFVGATVFNALLRSLVYALRDRDEDETYIEKVVSSWGSALTGTRKVWFLDSELLPIGMIPWVKDILSLMEGYDVERTDMSIVTDAIRDIRAALNGESGVYDRLKAAASAISAMTGIPVKNLWRDIESIALTFTTGKPISETSGEGFKWAYLEGIGVSDTRTSNAARLVKAYADGDETEAASVLMHMTGFNGWTEDEVQSAVQRAAKDAYLAGDIDEDTATNLLMEYGGVEDEDEAFFAIDRWTQTALHEGEEDYSYSRYHTVISAVQEGTGVDAAIRELTARGVSEGSIRSTIRSTIGEWYTQGEITQAQATQLLKKYGAESDDEDGYTDSDVYWQFDRWEYAEANGGSTEGYSRYDRLHTALETGSGINAAVEELLAHGYDTAQVTTEARGYLKELYVDGQMDWTVARSRLTGMYPDEYDENELHFTQKRWDYEREYGVSTGSDYCYLYRYIEERNNTAIISETKDMIGYGKKESNMASAIVSHFEPVWVELMAAGKTSEANALKQQVLNVCGYLGVNKSRAVNNWGQD